MINLAVISAFAASQFIPFNGVVGTGNHLSVDLVVSLRMEDSATPATDASGNARNFSETGSLSWAQTGIVGSSLQFSHLSGTTDYIGRSSDAGLTFGSQPFTIAAWVEFSARSLAPNDMSIIGKGEYGSLAFSWWLWLDHGSPDDTMYFSFSADGTYTNPDASKELTFPITGEIGSGFNFIVVRYDGSDIKLSVTHYTASALETETTKAFAGPFYDNSGVPVIIGANTGSGIHHLGGNVDELNIWKRELTTCELEWLFTAKNGTFSTPNFDALTCVNP